MMYDFFSIKKIGDPAEKAYTCHDVKLITASVVLVGLILSLIPVITGIDKDSADAKQKWLLQSTVSRSLWPLCFMLGFVSALLCI